jgi:tRNA(Ile)-lysidine synthase
MGEATLEHRFGAALRRVGTGERPVHLLVAFSGGLDSTVLLHLLRFASPGLPLRLTAAHLDHGMRSSSAADAAWARGLCAAWQVPLESGTARRPLRGEAAAREERYRFLWRTAARLGAERVVTAHHADDQAETVLFRILRGTGLAGLRGMPPATRAGLVRPLLDVWREELAEYAHRHDLAWRTDPTNATHSPARNRIRLRLLPEIEREVAPGARRSLLALAELARESEAGWREMLNPLWREIVRRDGAALVIARAQLRGYHPAVQVRLLRRALRRFGLVPPRLGTRSALQFITHAPSGREMQLAGGVRIRTEFDDARMEIVGAAEPDVPLVIHRPEVGEPVTGEVRLGGAGYRVSALLADAGTALDDADARWRLRLPAGGLHFPVTLRARAAGDRLSTPGGTKSLKKWMIERRVPRSERATIPVLVDAAGAVLWAGGLTARPDASAADDGLSLHLAIADG